MNLKKTLAAAGVGSKLRTEAKKPENQARVRAAITRLRSRRQAGGSVKR